MPNNGMRWLCLVFFMFALVSSTTVPARPERTEDPLREYQDLLDATKHSPSLQPGSGLAGRPIHVDPYVHSSGMAGTGHKHGNSKAC